MHHLGGQSYEDHREIGWSRIDMLTQLYEAAVAATQQVADALSQNSSSAASPRVRAIALVNAIESGLDLSQGEIPLRIQQLCHYVQQCLLSGEIAKTESAVRILQQLSDGFSQIRKEALQLEAVGEIPPLQLPTYDTLA